jgi:AraC family transcriptional regulator
MKKETRIRHTNLANDLLYYIYTHIDTDINLDELSDMFGINKFSMHKIFKEIFGSNIYESIKSIRLQKASNLLLTNPHSTITQIANACGYASQTSFIRAYKERFGMTPTQWRKGGYLHYSQRLLTQADYPKETTISFENLQPAIVKMPTIEAYYIRHKGYKETIRLTWQKIQAWLYSHPVTHYTLLSLFHDNPAITPLDDCHHVTCIRVDDPVTISDQKLPKLTISEGLYAAFELEGKRGDILRFIHWVYHEWLPQSGYETTTKPPYAIYRKNHHLSQDGWFEMTFYLSIRF